MSSPQIATETINEDNQRHNDNVEIGSNMCHQCQRIDKESVVRCQNCRVKRYCIPCLKTWYPRIAEEDIAKKCPVCCNICNCMSCLRMNSKTARTQGIRSHFSVSIDEEVQCSKYILRMLLPPLKAINDEQVAEKEIEAKSLGLVFEEMKLEAVKCSPDDSLYCDICKTSILDLHRSCSSCSSDICLTCCHEIRKGKLETCQEEVSWNYISHGFRYTHGGERYTMDKFDNNPKRKDHAELPFLWKANETGSITCYCGGGDMELKCLFDNDWISVLVKKGEETAEASKFPDSPDADRERCPCFNANGHIDTASDKLLKAASRESLEDNYLYCSSVRDDLKHFQHHWVKGEPVVVRNVLESTLGLSWEPMVMYRACRNMGEHGRVLAVDAVDCLDFSEGLINSRQFFAGYTEGRYDHKGWPLVLKMKWLPSYSFKESLQRHCEEFLCSLPLKQYTHPNTGPLNLAVKLSKYCLKPNMGPKLDIGYGYPQEFGRGDSVTKLHFNTSDVVKVLTHICDVPIKKEYKRGIEILREEHARQDLKELFGSEGNKEEAMKVLEETNDKVEDIETDDGALWDIFRREDVQKLEEYIEKHHKEFRHIYCSPVSQVVHPIHDQTFYLTRYHKKKLKEEYGIEPWTIVQKLGDAVLVPAGCPHQVRNLKSCIKVGLGFISPENVGECLRLSKEIRLLPPNHPSREDNLEIKKMIVFAVNKAIKDSNPNAIKSPVCFERCMKKAKRREY